MLDAQTPLGCAARQATQRPAARRRTRATVNSAGPWYTHAQEGAGEAAAAGTAGNGAAASSAGTPGEAPARTPGAPAASSTTAGAALTAGTAGEPSVPAAGRGSRQSKRPHTSGADDQRERAPQARRTTAGSGVGVKRSRADLLGHSSEGTARILAKCPRLALRLAHLAAAPATSAEG